jgi:folate-binding protein YgfZ
MEMVEANLRAFRDGALVFDRSARTRGVFPGAKAAEVLNGLVTNDVAALEAGRGLHAAALTPKGKVIADVRIFRRAEDFLVDAPAAAAPGWWTMVHKYVNPRLTRYREVSGELGDVSVFGRRAMELVAALTGESLADVPMYSHRTTEVSGAAILMARVPDAGVEGVTLFVPDGMRAAIAGRLSDLGAMEGLPESLEIARIRAGRPAWGLDMDETTLAQEARMDELGAISYEKGCYTGQETVARVHFRGHVNRMLRGICFARDVELARGTPLARSDGSDVGDVRSTALAPDGGIGLAMLRREVAIGERLTASIAGRPVDVEVVALPMV